MEAAHFWKNFRLGDELDISGAFIYNGLRQFHQMEKLEFTPEIFDFLYSLSVGFERLLKICVVLFEHTEGCDQEQLEKSLITHNHLDLYNRLRAHTEIELSPPQIALLQLLSDFYRSQRYGRFSITSISEPKIEKQKLLEYFTKHLKVEFEEDGIIGICNEDRYRKFVQKHVIKISTSLYQVVSDQSRELNLYTYELRYGSKAQNVFLQKVEISDEDILWKELLVFFMNTQLTSGYLSFLRDIEPLEFDPALVDEYLDCLKSDAAKFNVVGELEQLYEVFGENGGSVKERLEMMRFIASSGVYFDDEEDA